MLATCGDVTKEQVYNIYIYIYLLLDITLSRQELPKKMSRSLELNIVNVTLTCN